MSNVEFPFFKYEIQTSTLQNDNQNKNQNKQNKKKQNELSELNMSKK